MQWSYKTVSTPVGELRLIASEVGLAAILWQNDKPGRVPLPAMLEAPDNPVLCETERQLSEYFAGQRNTFSVPMDLQGTAFQKSVWKALMEIPFGETRSYSQIARQVGSPRAFRAVGAANGRNPVSILVPCHRAIGANGKLTGFAGGLNVKARLLTLERAGRSF